MPTLQDQTTARQQLAPDDFACCAKSKRAGVATPAQPAARQAGARTWPRMARASGTEARQHVTGIASPRRSSLRRRLIHCWAPKRWVRSVQGRAPKKEARLMASRAGDENRHADTRTAPR
jgi:hypothetical protein